MAEVKITIKVDDQTGGALGKLGGEASGAGASVKSLGDSCQSSSSRVMDFIKGLAGFEILNKASEWVKNLVTDFITFNSSNEQYLTTLKTLLGSQEAANDKFQELNDLARETPFQIDDLVKAFIKLKAMGLDPSIQQMTTLGDAVSALGGAPETFDRIARALGQINTKGKVSAEELMQLAENGIPAYEILRQKLGLTADQVANIGKYGVSSKSALDALFEGMAERYGGQMASLNDKWKGIIEELKSFWRDFMTDIGDAGAFDALKSKLNDLRTWIRELFKTGQAQQWAQDISTAISAVVTVGAEVAGVIKALWDILASAPSGAITYFENLSKGMSDAKSGADSLKGTVTDFTPWQNFQGFMSQWGENIVDAIVFAGKSAGAAIALLVTDAWDSLTGLWTVLEGLAAMIVGVFTLNPSTFISGVETIKNAMSTFVSDIGVNWNAFVKTIADAWSAMLASMGAMIPESVSSIVTSFVSGLSELIDSGTKAGVGMMSALISGIESLLGGLASPFVDIAGAVTSGLSSLPDIARDIGVSIMDSLISGLESLLGKLMETVSSIASAFSSLAGASASGVVLATGEYHTGGVIPVYHSGGEIPRYHTGGALSYDERLIIAQTGEGVVSRSGMSALERINSGAVGGQTINLSPSITVNASSGDGAGIARALDAELARMWKYNRSELRRVVSA